MPKIVFDMTANWGPREAVSLYLDRCQIDTPVSLVSKVWDHVSERRAHIGTVLDLGAGDGRFATGGTYDEYVGIEVDPSRAQKGSLPPNARILHKCAFEGHLEQADVCIGNPPYVRNQDLPEGWRTRAARVIQDLIGVRISGLANAWQYFAFLALAKTGVDGLTALVIPYEWVSRPSAAGLRDYVGQNRWSVDCYRLLDRTFDDVLTTCSITIIDKRSKKGEWRYFQELPDGSFAPLASPSGEESLLPYRPLRKDEENRARARRGLSPGTQRWLLLTEAERARNALRVGRDVLPCVRSLRPMEENRVLLSETAFQRLYRDSGVRCWLIRTDQAPSRSLKDYLNAVPPSERSNSTCNSRSEWWRFSMPEPPTLLVATGFRGAAPKVVLNDVGALAVGAVSGIYGISRSAGLKLRRKLSQTNLSGQVVAYSRGLHKLEVGQLQSLIDSL